MRRHSDGDAAIPLANRLRETRFWDSVIFTQDWHPAFQGSFAVNNAGAAAFSTRTFPDMGEQVMWPSHCVQGTLGAEFHPRLDRAPGDVVVRKGTFARAIEPRTARRLPRRRFELTDESSLLKHLKIRAFIAQTGNSSLLTPAD